EPMLKVLGALPLLASQCHAAAKAEISWLLNPTSTSPVAEVWATSNPHTFLWRLVDSSGAVLTESPEPSRSPGYQFIYGQCSVDGKLRTDLIVEALFLPNSSIAVRTKRTWLLYPSKKTIQLLSFHGAVCPKPEYGF